MFTKRLYYIFVSIFMLTSFFGSGIAQSDYRDLEAYAVYAAVIGEITPIQTKIAKRLVINAETVDYLGYGGKRMCLKPIAGDEESVSLIKAYTQANEKAWLLQRKFDISLPYQFITEPPINELNHMDAEAWAKFYEKYPDSGGAIHMSAVGFNADKTQAMVYTGYWCGSTCGEGSYHRLEKKNGKWTAVKWKLERSCGWIS